MHIIAGLGNPGLKYRKTPHNCGYMAADELAGLLKARFSKRNFNALLAEAFLNGEKLILLKPETYMNRSGGAVRAAMEFYNLSPDRLIVLYDDKDLEPGRLRIRDKGSAGSHNGMKSVIEALGTEEFPRVRMGIGKPEQMALMDHVLHKLSREEQKLYKDMAERAAKAALEIVTKGVYSAQQLYSSK